MIPDHCHLATTQEDASLPLWFHLRRRLNDTKAFSAQELTGMAHRQRFLARLHLMKLSWQLQQEPEAESLRHKHFLRKMARRAAGRPRWMTFKAGSVEHRQKQE